MVREAAETPRRAVIIASRIDALESLVHAAGHEVVGAAETALNGEHLLRLLRPDVVIVENDLVGPSGWEAIPDLNAASPATRVLLVVTDTWSPRDMGTTGAFAVVSAGRLGDLVGELERAAVSGVGPAGVEVGTKDRRTGRDRRLHQDWTKVGWERRCTRRRTPVPA
jgi:chemotaxis response regulator CheB